MSTQPPEADSTVLLICDVQERFRTAIYGFDAMTSTIRKIVKAAGLLNIPYIVTEQNPRALGSTVPELGLSDLPEQLNLGTYPKTAFSMYIPEVQQAVKSGIKTAIIVGIESHVCVLQTALDLLNAGLQVYIPVDGVSSCNRQEVPIALDRPGHAGAVITTSESLLFQLVRDASSPAFKPFSAIIKEEKPNTSQSLETLLDTPARSSL